MAGGTKLGGRWQSRHGGGGPVWSVHPLLACLAVCTIAYQVTRCTGQCANSERPTMMRIRRRHLDDMSTIASEILDQPIIIPNSYTDAQLLALLDRMRELAPGPVSDFEDSVGDEFSKALDAWIWMCRAQQTLGKRRKRENVTNSNGDRNSA